MSASMQPPQLLRLTWPLFVDNTLRMMATFCNVWIISRISDAAAAVAGVANVCFMVGFAVSECMAQSSAVVITQRLGSKASASAAQLYRVAMRLSCGVGLLLSVILLLRDNTLMTFLGGLEIGEVGTAYLKVIAVGFPLYALNYVLVYLLNIHGHARSTMFNTLAVNLGHLILAYGVAFYTPLPAASKLVGVAAAQLVVRGLGLAGNAAMCLRKLPSFGWRSLGGSESGQVAGILRIFASSVMRGVVVSGVPRGHRQADQHPRHAVIGRAVLCHRPVWCVRKPRGVAGQGSLIMVGYLVGAGRTGATRRHVARVARASVLAATCVAGIFLTLRWRLMGVFSPDPEVLKASAGVLLFVPILTVVRSVTSNLLAALRGAGDVGFTVACTLLGVWCVSLPLSWFTTQHTLWGLVGVWAAMIIDETLRCMLLWWRWHSGRWQLAAHRLAT